MTTQLSHPHRQRGMAPRLANSSNVGKRALDVGGGMGPAGLGHDHFKWDEVHTYRIPRLSPLYRLRSHNAKPPPRTTIATTITVLRTQPSRHRREKKRAR